MPNLNHIFDIIGGTTESEYLEFSPQLLVNWFLVSHPEAIIHKAIFPTPGLSLENGGQFNVGGDDLGGRAAYFFKNRGYVIFKDTIFVVDAFNNKITHSIIGKINTQTGYVGIADNGHQIVFVDGVEGWILDTTTSNFSQITSAGFPASPGDVTVLGNRFIVNKGETKLSYYSANGDGTSWGALDFFSLTSNDTVVGYGLLNGRLRIIGNTTTDTWYDAGAPTLPFRPQLPSFEFGCGAVGSVAKGFGILVWLSRTDKGGNSVVAMTGNQPTVISNEAIDREFDTYTRVSDASAYIYQNELGHKVYVINFTAENKSWMYDFNSKAWSKLESEGGNRHLGNNYLYLGTNHYVLDYSEPKMYQMSVNFQDDNGKTIMRRVVSPNFLFANEIRLNELKIIMKQGTGTQAGNDEDPVLRLRISTDGGNSYGAEIPQPIGAIGRRTQDTEFYDLGISDSFVFELTHYNKSPAVILGAQANIEKEVG